MKHARSIPLALFIASLIAATPASWGAEDRAAAAADLRMKPQPIAHRVVEVVDFVATLAGIPRGVVPLVAIDDLILDSATRLPRTRPTQPMEPKPCDPDCMPK